MTNPKICRHNVIVAGISHELELHIHCVSCETDLTDPATRVGKNYECDTETRVWVHKPYLKRKHRSLMNQFGVFQKEWEVYRDKERELGRRIIPFEDWRNEGPQGEIRV